MRIADAFVDELTLEAATTKCVLERVPEARLGWQPHPKSMSLGQLALHVATLPSLVTQFLSDDALDLDSVPKEPPTVATHALVSPSRPAAGLPAPARCAGALRLRADRGREPVCRCVTAPDAVSISRHPAVG